MSASGAIVVLAVLVAIVNLIIAANKTRGKENLPAVPVPAPPTPFGIEPIEPMQEADMPPALLLQGTAQDVIHSGFEERITSDGFKWFRPILTHLYQEVNQEPVPVFHALVSSNFKAKLADRLMDLVGINYGFGPQGRVFNFAGTGHNAPPVQAIRYPKRVLKAIQSLRRE